MAGTRVATRSRVTKETSIEIRLDLDGTGETAVATGVPFFDHMISQLGRHAGFDLDLKASGDLDVDTHHTVEDVGIALGECLREALGDKAGVRRFASISVPLDEALIEVALDLSGRPLPGLRGRAGRRGPGHARRSTRSWRRSSGGRSSRRAAITLHLRMRSGKNNHHILEASFKGVARALRDAVRIEGGGVPSTKGQL